MDFSFILFILRAMKTLDFEKTTEGRWYVVLPEWTGTKADLEMVMGADMMLDIYAQGEDKVSLSASESEAPGYDILGIIEVCSTVTGGAYYQIGKINGIDYDFKVWLCDVTKFVFGDFPDTLFLSDCTI